MEYKTIVRILKAMTTMKMMLSRKTRILFAICPAVVLLHRSVPCPPSSSTVRMLGVK